MTKPGRFGTKRQTARTGKELNRSQFPASLNMQIFSTGSYFCLSSHAHFTNNFHTSSREAENCLWQSRKQILAGKSVSRVKKTHSQLLIMDEVDFLTLEKTQSSLLFHAICGRYEKCQPIILTSNKAFPDWAQIFTDDNIMAWASLDRLLNRFNAVAGSGVP